jgi:hypothetical protein
MRGLTARKSESAMTSKQSGLAMAVAVWLALSACSCNGQKRTNGPDNRCEPAALLAEMKAMYSDLLAQLQPVDSDCDAVTSVLDAWLDANEQRFLQLHVQQKSCPTDPDEQELPRLIGSLVLSVDPCRSHSESAREANDRLLKAADGEMVPLGDHRE